MVASVASCLQKIGFARFSVVTELLAAQGQVFRKSMHTDTVFRKLPLCLNPFWSQHASRAKLSSLPPPTGLVYRSFYWATWLARRHRARLQPWSNAAKDTVQTPAFHTSPLALTESRCTASSHSATPRKSPLHPALYRLLPSGCRLCGLKVGRPAFQLPMFEKCDSLPKKRFVRHVCLRNPCRVSKSKPPLPSRSLRSLRAVARSTSSALWLHQLHHACKR